MTTDLYFHLSINQFFHELVPRTSIGTVGISSFFKISVWPTALAKRALTEWIHSRSPNSQRSSNVPPHGPLAKPLGQVSGQIYKVSPKRHWPQLSQPTTDCLVSSSVLSNTLAIGFLFQNFRWKTDLPIPKATRELNISSCIQCKCWYFKISVGADRFE